MIAKNLKLALQLNNYKINQEINLIIDYLNDQFTDQKILHYEINKHFDSLTTDLNNGITNANTNLNDRIDSLNTYVDTELNKTNNNINSVNTLLTYKINALDTNLIREIRNLTDYIDEHKNNTVVHVTQADKDLWNATLQNAKDYAQELFNRLNSFEIILCTELPTKNIKPLTIYFLQIDPEQNDLYEEYMYINNKWEKIGNTRIDLSDYVTKSMLQSEVNTLNNIINSKEDSINQSISNLTNKHNQDVSNLINDLNSLSVNHNNDINEIQSDISDIEQSITDLDTGLSSVHTHDNKNILDKFSLTSKDKLLYDGKKVIEEFTEQDVRALINYLWNIEEYNFLTFDNKYILTYDNYIFTGKEGDS